MHGNVPVPLLVSTIFLNVVQEVTADDDGVLHFLRDNNSPIELVSKGCMSLVICT